MILGDPFSFACKIFLFNQHNETKKKKKKCYETVIKMDSFERVAITNYIIDIVGEI
jgi:hypothetical protein